MVSIIIPTYNEIDNIAKIEAVLADMQGDFEVIFTDGYSTDGTFDKISYPKIQETKTRALQMNAAAKYAHGDYLFFLHCDSIIGADAINQIENSGRVCGCFTLKFMPSSFIMKWGELFSNIRVRMKHIAFGDQGIFIRRDLFNKIGGYREIPIMEDLALSEDLLASGHKIKQIDYPIITSTRRFESKPIRVGIKMKKLQKMFRAGYPIEKIAEIYNNM